jgi:GNAT superfamily N-acetyltransferase
MSIEIRRAVVADAETVLTMMGELADYQDQRAYLTASGADWEGFLARDDVIVLIAAVEGADAGYVSALRRPYLWVGGDQLALDDLYVRKEFRDAGAGHRLMLELARIALPERLPIGWGLRLENTAGYRFYERLGARMVTKTAAAWTAEAYEGQIGK